MLWRIEKSKHDVSVPQVAMPLGLHGKILLDRVKEIHSMNL